MSPFIIGKSLSFMRMIMRLVVARIMTNCFVLVSKLVLHD
jgi:hypothetical protein